MDLFGLEYARVASANAAFPAIVGENGEITHAQFWKLVRTFASGFARDGVDETSVVAITSEMLVTVLAAVIATSLRGARLITAESAIAKAGIDKPTHFYRTVEMTAGKKFKLFDEEWLKNTTPDDESQWLNPRARPQSDWLTLHTSGTTGRQKYFCLTQEMVLDRKSVV